MQEEEEKYLVVYLNFNDWILLSKQATIKRISKKDYIRKLISNYINNFKNDYKFNVCQTNIPDNSERKSIPVNIDFDNWVWISHHSAKNRMSKKNFITLLLSTVINDNENEQLDMSVA